MKKQETTGNMKEEKTRNNKKQEDTGRNKTKVFNADLWNLDFDF